VREYNGNILKALEMARELIRLADEGESVAENDSCVLLYGVIRDCAYKIRRQAEKERDAHVAARLWDEPSANGESDGVHPNSAHAGSHPADDQGVGRQAWPSRDTNGDSAEGNSRRSR